MVNGLPPHDLNCLCGLDIDSIKRSGLYEETDGEVNPSPLILDKPNIDSVLVFTPTLRLEDETVKSIFGLRWSGRLDFFFTRDNPYTQDEGYRNIYWNLVKAKNHFTVGGWDAVLIVESDMVVPSDAIEKLSVVDADVVGGVYVMRRSPISSNVMIYDPSGPDNLSALNVGQLNALPETGWCNGVSFGCTMIKKSALDVVDFRDVFPNPPDVSFMADCNRAGLRTAYRRSVSCGHIREDGLMLTL